MLVNTKELLEKARKGHFAVPAFNTSDLEMTMGIMKACEALKSPVILATSERQVHFSNEKKILALLKSFAEQPKLSVAIHLDHGTSFEQAKRCIDAGYTSVHFDGSLLDYKENVRITKKVVAYARKRGVTVEGELGHIFTPKYLKDKTDRTKHFTNPYLAREFVKNTGIDSLAIAIGTAHGPYKGETKIDFERLQSIAYNVKIPLVLHGGSLVSAKDIRKAIEFGIAKINVNTELRLVFSNYLREYLPKHKKEYVPEEIMKGAIEAVRRVCEEKIKTFKSENK